MTTQLLQMPPRPMSGSRTQRSGHSGAFRSKRHMYFPIGNAGAVHVVRLRWSDTLKWNTINIPATIAPVSTQASAAFAVDGVDMAVEGADLPKSKLAAIRAFKGGSVLIAAGALAGAATFVVAAPILSGASAVLTVAGGLIAAGATERYRRGG